MREAREQRGRRSQRGAAFSVIELMLAIAIMGVIVYTLFSVFNHTQKALRASHTQGDVSEKARAIMEMVSRELEQAHPTMAAAAARNNLGWVHEINLQAGAEWLPQIQTSDRAGVMPRTNILHNLFFLNIDGHTWTGIGYRVTNVVNGVGVLVRYQLPYTNAISRIPEHNILLESFINEPQGSTNYHHVADGVIHFELKAYDKNGTQYRWDSTNLHNTNFVVIREDAAGDPIVPFSSTFTNVEEATITLQQAIRDFPEQTRFTFSSNAMPAYVELELGMLEPETLRQFYTMLEDENPNATNFLSKQIAKVHLFRQMIPIRTAAQ